MTITEERLFKSAASEINGLRQRNKYLEARLSGFDDALKLLNTQPLIPTQGFAPDIVYEIEEYLTSISAEPIHQL